MVAEIIKVVDAVSEAKDVDREIIFEAIENALESATKKKYAVRKGKEGDSWNKEIS